MGLFDGIKNRLTQEFIDIIEWLDPTQDTLVHRFERYKNEIKNEAQLIVREGQKAVFVSEGKLADIFSPGTYTLTTENLPILTTLRGWKYGFNSPFKAEVYFINTRLFTDEKWGTKAPIILQDDRYGLVEIRAFGTYSFRIKDAGIFIKDIVGTDGDFTNFEINEHLKSLIATRFTNVIGKAKIPIEYYAANTSDLGETCQKVMAPEFDRIGIELERFYIENVSMPEELKKEIFEYSRLHKIDLQKLSQLKTAKAIEEAAKNDSGTAGAGMGMGMGFALAQQMSSAIQPQAQPQMQPSPPPLIPTETMYYYAVDNVQNGPVTLQALQILFASRKINKDTLVWKQGMDTWKKVSEDDKLKEMMGSNTPPPLPE